MHAKTELGKDEDASRWLAAVDLGSNSFHMLLARQSQAGLETVDRLREPVRLGAGLQDDGRLDEAAKERGLAAIRQFAARLDGLGKVEVAAVGTNALRVARNAGGFLASAGKLLGCDIRVISGEEEAMLIYRGVTEGLPADSMRCLVIDIGGGSSELVAGCEDAVSVIESLQLGCVSLARRHFPDRCIDAASMQQLRSQVEDELVPAAVPLRAHGWDRVFGCSGSIITLASLAMEVGGGSRGVSRDSLALVEARLVELRHFDEFLHLGVTPDRAEVLASGLCILAGIMDALGLDHIDVADASLRDGLILDLADSLEQAGDHYQGR